MDEFVETFREIAGEHLRVVATFESLDYEVAFIRDDLAGEYSAADREQAYQSIVGTQVSTDDFSKIGTFGGLDAQVVFFEGITVFVFPASRYDGIFVSIDRSPPDGAPRIRDVIERAADLPQTTTDPTG